ncbi:hypothetical protein [Sulfobacillus harzensis]|uniref:DUF1453 domain-containing protein n=1 Tax=Sulfobacillus harzensis TaxID=2729629 RepID=A0A7Y0Q5V4_9FIRM|nr:hypothetical protein [Sulfobacillus harzensis]NMP24709.1 hypothetical protein [Sulfobacillus harzensis]
MPNWLSDVIGLGLLVFFIVRQVTPRRPTRLRFYILPIVGLYWAYHTLPHPMPAVQVADALMSIAVSVPFGIMQAYFTRLYEKDGRWFLQGDWRYVVSWLVLFALHGVTAVVLHEMTAVTWVIGLEVAVVWGLRSLVLHLRYPQLSGILARK